MSERLAPIDEFSGLPLPIMPMEVPEHIARSKLAEEYVREDLHHAFFPNFRLESEGERVIRHARVQLGPRWAHSRYHNFYDGVPLPDTTKRQFALGVLATAGYIPEQAVDVGGREPKIVRLTPEIRQQMHKDLVRPEVRAHKQTGRDFYQMRRGVFFMEYALDQKLDHIRQTLLEEFLETPHDDRRLKLGFFIIDMAFARATEPIEGAYKTAYDRGLIRHDLPKHPVGFVRKVIEGHQPDYLNTLAERIREPVRA